MRRCAQVLDTEIIKGANQMESADRTGQPRPLAALCDEARRVVRYVPCPPALVVVLGDVPGRCLFELANAIEVPEQTNGT